MSWNLDKNRPICPQLCEQISVKIACGELKPGEKLMSVREVALSARFLRTTLNYIKLGKTKFLFSHVQGFLRSNTI